MIMIIIVVIIIEIMIIMLKTILRIAVVIINSPFQPGAFSTGSTTATYKKVPIFFTQSYFKKP